MTKTLIGTPDPDQPSQPVHSDVHAERMVLAALLTYPSLTAHLTTVLDGTDFTVPAHRQVFLAATAAHDRGRPCTPADIATYLPDHQPTAPGTVTAPESEQLMRELAGTAPAEPVTVYYAAIVRDLAALRRRKKPRPHPEGFPPAPMRGFLTDEGDT
ncbi:DnaB-like helicase N-terminal domain-containing protein [Streptomyces sp. NBC_01262]|uniref:DnaB-like helicase N-terminal domain-containing protein n=1 Tax=Streptomyces sp. NBC_01262 TaxID=2903803 RepID=UPI002E311D75|nr:DnaB-like helicase N-terminal domain-containing protein [Streptomyces sp. NBC_01262]